jgi:hypothetical protein
MTCVNFGALQDQAEIAGAAVLGRRPVRAKARASDDGGQQGRHEGQEVLIPAANVNTSSFARGSSISALGPNSDLAVEEGRRRIAFVTGRSSGARDDPGRLPARCDLEAGEVKTSMRSFE